MARPGVAPPSCRTLFRDVPQHALRARRKGRVQPRHTAIGADSSSEGAAAWPCARGTACSRFLGKWAKPPRCCSCAAHAAGGVQCRRSRWARAARDFAECCSAAGPAQGTVLSANRRQSAAPQAAAPHSRGLWRSGLARRGRLPVAGDDCGRRGLATGYDQQAGNPLPKTHRQPAAGWRGVRSCAIAPPRHRYPAAPQRRSTALAGV